MKRLISILAVSLALTVPASAQYAGAGYPPGGGGGAPAFPLLPASGCSPVQYSFADGPLAGMCYNGGTIIQNNNQNSVLTLPDLGPTTLSITGLSGRTTVFAASADSGSQYQSFNVTNNLGYASSIINQIQGVIPSFDIVQSSNVGIGTFAFRPDRVWFTLEGGTAVQEVELFLRSDSLANNFLTFTNISTPSKTVSLSQSAFTPSFGISVSSALFGVTTLYDGSDGSYSHISTDGSSSGWVQTFVGVARIRSSTTNENYVQAQSSGIRINTSGTKPTCDAAAGGSIWREPGGAAVADTFEVCRKDAADAYAWVSLF